MDVDDYLRRMATTAVTEAVQVLRPGAGPTTSFGQLEELDGAGAGCCTVRTHLAPPTDSPTIVVKVFSLVHEESETLSEVPGSVDYWRREWLFYRASWTSAWPVELGFPTCLASGEFLDDEGRPVLWLALEDLGRNDRDWALSSFVHVARQAGILNGWSMTTAAVAPESWLTTGWLLHGATHRASALPVVQAHVDHPVLGRIVDQAYLDEVSAFWAGRDTIADTLRALPQVLCHNDLYPRNVFAGPDRSVAVDWAYLGWGVVGQELSALIGASAIFRTRPATEWPDLESRCLEGYAAGLRAAGWNGSEREVLLGYRLAFGLRYGVDMLQALLDTTLNPDLYDVIADFTGCSYEEYVVNMRALITFTHERIRWVRTELGV